MRFGNSFAMTIEDNKYPIFDFQAFLEKIISVVALWNR